MYLPPLFEETRIEVLAGLIREHPLATLVTQNASGLVANHIPMEFDPAPAPFGVLRAHVARANPVWRETRADSEVMVIFQGPSTYVTPAWYATKKETGKVVPTWNYAIVQVRGTARVIDDAAWLKAQVEALTGEHEKPRAEQWAVSDVPESYIASQLKGIIGERLEILGMQGKWKVSQNRNAEDRKGVVDGLRADDTPAQAAMADLVAAVDRR